MTNEPNCQPSAESFDLRYDDQTDHPLEVAGILRAMMPDNVRVLDVGCGTGSVTVIANAQRQNEVTAIEPNPARAEKARSRGIAVTDGFLDDDFVSKHDQFDVVVSSDVLEHVENPSRFLLNLRRVLKDDGLLLVSVPNVAHWSIRANLLMGKFDYQPTGIMDETHLRWFTASSFRKLLESCGFEIVEFRQTAGTELSVYCHSKLRHIPAFLREPAVRMATRVLPTLFGAQHVAKAKKIGAVDRTS
jgi:methionine biosynthesis protein MetW